MGFQFQSTAAVAPLMAEDLGLRYTDIGFLIGLYMLPGIVLALPGGALGARFGDKRMVLLGLALMVAGGAMQTAAPDYGTVLAGRLIAGIGGVALSVIMTKMIVDGFAGGPIVLAMSVFTNSYPSGVGLALVVLGQAAAWRPAIAITSGVALVAFAAVALFYHRHENDRPRVLGIGLGAGMPGRAVALTLLAGCMWGIFNGAVVIMLGFAPLLLASRGVTVGGTALVGMAMWLFAFSIPLGGFIAQRWGHPAALMIAGCAGAAIALMLLPVGPPLPLLILAGLVTELTGEVFHGAQSVVPERLDLHRLAAAWRDHPVADLGVHPGELDSGLA